MANNIVKMFMASSKLSYYNALIKRANELGYTLPNSTSLASLKILLDDWDTKGYTAKLDYLRIGAYNDLNVQSFSLINIANPYAALAQRYNVGTGTVTYTAEGNKLNSTNTSNFGAIGTKITYEQGTAINYKQNSASRLYVIFSASGVTSSTSAIDGQANVTAETLKSENVNGQRITQGTTNASVAINMQGTGLKAVTRGASNLSSFYNKNVITTSTTPSQTPGINLGEFREGNSYNVVSVLGFSLSMIGSFLTQTEVEDIRSSFNTYLVNIGLTAFA